MKKIAMSVAAATMLLSGLTACGTTDEGTDMNANNYRQTGFEAQDARSQNNIRYRGEGPITDMMTPDDRNRTGMNGQYEGTRPRFNTQNNSGMGMRDGYGANDRTGITGGDRQGMVDNDGLLRGNARNGVMNNRGMDHNGMRSNNMTRDRGDRGIGTQNRAMNYHKDYDSRTAQEIAKSVMKINNVDDARVIVHKNDVVVGVETNGDMKNVRNEVEKKVKPLAKGKKVHVVTDSDTVDRVRTMDDRLRTGTGFEEIGSTFTDMLNDVGRAVQRPFER